ncbi:MAG TPA: hypothetical protein IAA13_01510 [Candidatus Alistipes merdigallinarum]|nr:hypothetical protein [Candidatus Alistipes merdigallinarum]
MKKYLQFCLMGLLVLGMGLSLGSCKDENEGSGSPNPLLGVQVDLSEIDSTAIALVDIDQANKLITISLSKTVTDLSAVPVTFDLVNGAYLYSPYVTNPVLMDLSEETGVNIATGDNIVCYKLVAEEDQALRSLKATAGGIEAITNVDQANRLIDICFEDNEVDLSAINLEFELSPVSNMVSPSTPTATVDLSADTSIVKVYNEFKGEVEYKVICWNYPTGGVMDVKEYSDVQVTAGAEGEFQIKTTGENPAILTNRYPVSYGMVMEFEYKSDVDLGRPVFSLDLNNKDLQIRGYELDATSDWKTMAIDISTLYFDAAKILGKSYTVHMALGEEIPEGTNISIRNFTVRERNFNEEMGIELGYWPLFNSGSGNTCKVTDMTTNEEFPTVQFVCEAANDPYYAPISHSEDITKEMNQIYFYYKSETSFQQQIFMRAVDDTWSFRFADEEETVNYDKTTQKPELRYTYEPTDIWTCVHFDATYALETIFEAHGDAGAGNNSIRWDPEAIGTLNAPIIYRNIRFVQASYE